MAQLIAENIFRIVRTGGRRGCLHQKLMAGTLKTPLLVEKENYPNQISILGGGFHVKFPGCNFH